MGLCSPPALLFWFTHAYKIVFDCTLVVTAQMFQIPINYWLQQISLDKIIFILVNDLVNDSPCQKPTEYQAKCFTVFSFVRGLKWLLSLGPLWLHILSHVEGSHHIFSRDYHRRIWGKMSHQMEKITKNSPVINCYGVSFGRAYTWDTRSTMWANQTPRT